MLTEIELCNIRVFDGSGWKFPLPPLTVLCGTNGSGKSTILKTILLLKQAQSTAYSERGGRLRLAGSQVDLGTFQSLVSGNQNQKRISITLTIEDTLQKDQIRFLELLDTEDFNPDELQDDPTPVPYRLRVELTFGLTKHDAHTSRTSRGKADKDDDQNRSSSSAQGKLQQANFTMFVNGASLLTWSVMAGSTRKSDEPDEYRLCLPQKLFDRAGGFQAMDVDQPEHGNVMDLDVVLHGMLPTTIVAKFKAEANEGTSTGEKQRWSIFPLPPYINDGLIDFRRALSRIHYIGPLRSPAKRYYVANLDAAPDLDSSGEFLPYILKDKRDSTVTCVLPGKTKTQQMHLGKALDLWLYYFRTGKVAEGSIDREVDIQVTGDVLVEFRLRTAGGSSTHALADSGFGYSQVLPIVVRCLLAQQGSTLLIEQPELHLNPALQVRLAEFFVAVIRDGKQVLIETHSEHIVNGIRVSAAEDVSGDLAEKCKILFLQSSTEGTHVHELGIQRDGTVPDWPFEFFGEAISLSGRLLRAQKRFVSAKKGK